jgi:hypothetical protein
VTVFAQTLLAFVGGNLVAFSLFTARHRVRALKGGKIFLGMGNNVLGPRAASGVIEERRLTVCSTRLQLSI